MDRTPEKNTREILDSLFSGDLPAELQEQIIEWYGRYGHLPEKDVAMREVFSRTVTANHNPSPEVYGKLAAIKEQLGLPEPQPLKMARPATVKRFPVLRKSLVRFAAVLIPLLLIVASAYLWLDGPGSTRDTDAGVNMATVTVSSGDNGQTITLPDGSEVRLAEQTEISYAEDFLESREVFIEGEAFFSVAHMGGKPFTVHSRLIDVTVLGTQFIMRAFGDESTAEVKLTSGKVAVSAADIESVMMEPGQHFVYDRTMQTVSLDGIPEGELLRLLGEGLDFKAEPLDGVFRIMGQYYGKRLEVYGKLDLETPVTAAFGSDISLDEALNIIQMTNDLFDYTINGDVVTITKRN